MITARIAGSIVRGWLRDQGIYGLTVKARTISFSDLARASAVFVSIEDAEALTQEEWAKLYELSRINRFFIG